MMIEPNYYVNIAKDGRHFCTAELGSCERIKAMEKLSILNNNFPADEGWDISMHYVECYGTCVAARIKEVR